MSPALERLRLEAASLDAGERELLALDLLQSLDDSSADEIEREWNAEAIRRIEAHDRGESQSFSEEEVFARLGLRQDR